MLGGYLRPNLYLGGESSAWVHTENGADNAVSFVTGVAQWYPNVKMGFYLRAGLGLNTYESTDGTGKAESSAGALTVGTGYDIRVGRNFSLTPYATYHSSAKGEISVNGAQTGVTWSINVLQIGLGFTWH